jgi:hypothetical protein
MVKGYTLGQCWAILARQKEQRKKHKRITRLQEFKW